MNEFEILLFAIYIQEGKYNDIVRYINLTALYVKNKLNDKKDFTIFEAFYQHNYSQIYEEFLSLKIPVVDVTLNKINLYYKTLMAPFELKENSELHDYNYEVDELNNEHMRREAHTTKNFNHESDIDPKNRDRSESSIAETTKADCNASDCKLISNQQAETVCSSKQNTRKILCVDSQTQEAISTNQNQRRFTSIKEKRESKLYDVSKVDRHQPELREFSRLVLPS
mmetsp:Transcript_10548/g.11850  ORF Transcript_10548/g.11850 Transcript_10548/m.11850 type:complete len:226 (+) Transcript_10548:211-888(+)